MVRRLACLALLLGLVRPAHGEEAIPFRECAFEGDLDAFLAPAGAG